MTAFTKGQMPDSINTVEEVFVWAASILAELNAAEQVAVDRNSTLRVCDARPALLEFATTDPERFAVAAYIPLNPTWRTNKAWFNGVKEFSTTTIPANYSANN